MTIGTKAISSLLASIMVSIAYAQAAPSPPDHVESLYQALVKIDLDIPAPQNMDYLSLLDAWWHSNLLAQVRNKANAGDAHAQVVMANFYGGTGMPLDLAQMASWYRKAADQGDSAAQYNLGSLYDNGEGVPQDYAQAASWYRKAADHGFARAQDKLGLFYYKGQGVPQDYAQAASWYRKAADQGFDLAQYNLGVFYYKGQGVPQDYAQAASWFRKAADQGDSAAQYNLGVFYYKGQGVPQDSAMAEKLFEKAAARYNLEAARGLRLLQTEFARQKSIIQPIIQME